MDHWPDPSLIQQYLFDNWVPGLGLALVVGVTLGVMGLRRANNRLLVAALVVLLVGGLFPVVEMAVVTSREQFIDRTTQLAGAVLDETGTAAFAELLTEDVAFNVGAGADPYLKGRDRITNQADRAQRRYEFRGYTYYIVDACQLDENTAESYLKIGVKVHSKDWDLSVPKVSAWVFGWTRAGDRWLVKEVRWLTLDNQEATTNLLP